MRLLPRWAAVVFVVPFVIACAFTFPSLDDWCYGASGHRDWWAAQTASYNGWSGRITAIAVITGWGSLGSPWFAAMFGYRLVIVAIGVLASWIYWDVIGAFFPDIQRRERGTLTVAGMAGSILLLNDPLEGLYWLSGIASYTLGAASGLLACSSLLWAARGVRWRWWLAVFALVWACLSSEVVAAVTLTGGSGIIIGCLRGGERWRGLAVLVAGLLATGLSLLAPGNQIRVAVAMSQGLPAVDHSVGSVLSTTMALAWAYLADSRWAAVAALGAWLASHSPLRQTFSGGLVMLFIPVLVLAAALPLAWAGMSPGRAWNPLAMYSALLLLCGAWLGGPRLVLPLLLLVGLSLVRNFTPGMDGLVVSWCAWSIPLGMAWLLRPQLERQVFLAMLAVALLLGSERFIGAIPQLARGPELARQQANRLRILAEAPPRTAVVLPGLTGDMPYLYHIADLTRNEQAWPNQGAALFFDLKSVRIK